MKNYMYPEFKNKMQLFFILLLTISYLNKGICHMADNNLQCPADITIGCCNDYNNTDLTGHPMMNNPSFANFTYEDELHLNQCNEGYLIRTWTGVIENSSYECEQLITMEYQSTFDGNIQWPSDWEGSCMDEIPFSMPVYDPGFCDLMAYSHSDDTIYIQGSVCMEILRNWKIIDWCKYQPNSGSDLGLWEHTQVLKIVESDPPVFESCSEWEVDAMNDNCTADFEFHKKVTDENCGELSEINWKVQLDFNNDWTLDSTLTLEGSEVNFEIKNLPIGTHSIKWIAYDPCGNASQCMELIQVADAKPPTPFCYLSFPTVLMPLSNMLEVNADMFVKDAIDNCSETTDLIHSWSPDPADSIRVFDCDDIGYQFIPLYTIDETGNNDFCFVFTRVVNHGDCSSTFNIVNGEILDYTGNPMSGIQLGLGNNEFNIHYVDTTAQDGIFSFPYHQTLADPSIYFSETYDPALAYTTLDLVILQRYLLGLNKPNRKDEFLLAADINEDHQINLYDLFELRNIILGIGQGGNGVSGFRIFMKDPLDPEKQLEIKSLKKFETGLELRAVRKGKLSRFF